MNRDEKLERLKSKQLAPVLVTGVEPFIEALEKKIDSMQNTLGQGIQITNLEELLDQFSTVKDFALEVKQLRDTVGSIKYPDSVSVEGLEALIKATEAVNNTERLEKSIDKLSDTFEIIRRAVTQDIYATYAFANSAIGVAGQYIGHLAGDGRWFIQKIGVGTDNTRSSTFASGSTNYSVNWKQREKLDYLARDKVQI